MTLTQEVHWNRLHRGIAGTAAAWLRCVFQHRRAKFFLLPWPKERTKEYVVLRFIERFTAANRLVPPYDLVVFLDYDSSHARARIQNVIRETGQVLRCYHLDSSRNDCLQCCDLMLGATVRLFDDPEVMLRFPDLDLRFKSGIKLTDSEVKVYIAGYLGTLVERDATCVYDLWHR